MHIQLRKRIQSSFDRQLYGLNESIQDVYLLLTSRLWESIGKWNCERLLPISWWLKIIAALLFLVEFRYCDWNNILMSSKSERQLSSATCESELKLVFFFFKIKNKISIKILLAFLCFLFSFLLILSWKIIYFAGNITREAYQKGICFKHLLAIQMSIF